MTGSVDFNDLEGIAGVGEVKRQIDQAAPVVPVVPTDWSAPMIPGGLSTPEIPANLLPGVWGNFAQAVSESTQTPAAMSVMCCLGVLATLLQRRFEVSPDGTNYFEPLSLFVTTVSPSGTRKTAVMGVLKVNSRFNLYQTKQ